MKVYESTCGNCLLSSDSIVSPNRRQAIIKECVSTQSHFICHKATMNGEDVCCRKFYENLGHTSQMIRIAERLNTIEFIPQPHEEKLLTYSEMKGKKLKLRLNERKLDINNS